MPQQQKEDDEGLFAGLAHAVSCPGSAKCEDWLDNAFYPVVRLADALTATDLVKMASTITALSCHRYGSWSSRVQEMPLLVFDALLKNKSTDIQRSVISGVLSQIRKEIFGSNTLGKVLPVSSTLAKSSVYYALRIVLRVSQKWVLEHECVDQHTKVSTFYLDLLAHQVQLLYVYLHRFSEEPVPTRVIGTAPQKHVSLYWKQLLSVQNSASNRQICEPAALLRSTIAAIIEGKIGASPECVFGSAVYLCTMLARVQCYAGNQALDTVRDTSRADVLKWLAKEVYGAKTPVSESLSNCIAPGLKGCTRNDFETCILPVIEKALLRSPEVVLSVYSATVSTFNFDLLFDSLIEPLLTQLRTKNDVIRSEALNILCNIIMKHSHDHHTAYLNLITKICTSVTRCTSSEQRSAHYMALQSFVNLPASLILFASSQLIIEQMTKALATDNNETSLGTLYDLLLQHLVCLLSQPQEKKDVALLINPIFGPLIKAIGDEKKVTLRKFLLRSLSRRLALLEHVELSSQLPGLITTLLTLTEKYQIAPLTSTLSFAEATAAIHILMHLRQHSLIAGKEGDRYLKLIRSATSLLDKKPGFMIMDKLYTKVTASEDMEAYLAALCTILIHSSTLLAKNTDADLVRISVALVYAATLSSNYVIRNDAIKCIAEIAQANAQILLRYIVPAVNAIVDDICAAKLPNSRHRKTTFGKLLLAVVTLSPDTSQETIRLLLIDLIFSAHHPLVALPDIWTQLVYKKHLDAEQVLREDPAPRRVIDICIQRGFESGIETHRQCSIVVLRTCCFVSPAVYLPLLNGLVIACHNRCQAMEVADIDFAIWKAPEGELYVDVSSLSKAPDSRRKVEGTAAKVNTDAAKSVIKSKFSKEEQAQLTHESSVRAELTSIRMQIINALDMVAAMCCGINEILANLIPGLVAFTMESAKRYGVLLNEQVFYTYIEIGKCLDERIRDYLEPLAAASFRLTGILNLPIRWQEVNLDALNASILFKLRYATASVAFDSISFVYIFRLLQAAVYSANARVQVLMRRHPTPTEQLQLDNWLDQLSLSCDIIASHVSLGVSNDVPRQEMLALLKYLLSQRLKLRSVSKQALIELAEATGETAQASEEQILLEGLFDPIELVREACSESLSYLSPIKETESQLSLKIFVLKHDDNVRIAKPSNAIWDGRQLSLPVIVLDELLDLTAHEVPAVRFDAARSLRSFISIHSSITTTLLQRIYSRYKILLEPEKPKVDEYGMVMRGQEPRDRFEARHGLARALHHIVDVVSSDQVKGIITFLIDSEALGDNSEDVRNEMMQVGTLLVTAHSQESCDIILPRLESYLSAQATHTVTHDHIREAVVILLGATARYLTPTDKRIPNVIEQLVGTLKTPSQAVQQAVGDHLPDLIRVRKDLTEKLIKQLVEQCLHGAKFAERKGAAYGFAGVVKGYGIGALKQYGVMTALTEAIEGKKKETRGRQGALFALEALSLSLGRLFEPYVIRILPLLLMCFGDTSNEVRNATQSAARVIMGRISGHCIKLLLKSLLTGLQDDAWRTKKGSIELLSSMAYCAPKQLTELLPVIVPRLCEVLTDSHMHVQSAGRQALITFGEVIANPQIKSLVPTVLQALSDPDKYTTTALTAIGTTVFEHYIDAPSLALVMPLLQRGFRERGSDTRKKTALIVGNLCRLTESDDLAHYLNVLTPGIKNVMADPAPEVRATAARTLGVMVITLSESAFPTLISDLLLQLKSDTTPIDRSGAAQGLSEVLLALGVERLEGMLGDIVANCSSSQSHIREGYFSLLVHLPLTFGEEFTPYLSSIVTLILKGLADDTDTVRDIVLRAGRIMVTHFASSSVTLLLPELEKGLFDESRRIRLSSVQLIGELLYQMAGFTSSTSSLLTASRAVEEPFCPTAEDQEEVVVSIGAEGGRKMLIQTLGEERYQEVLSAIYIVSSDTNIPVRQAALHIWKALVSNTPRALKELLPVLMELIIRNLASDNEDHRTVAAQILGEIVRKLGERVLIRILPILETRSDDVSEKTRRGVCVGLQEVMHAAGKANVIEFSSSFVPAVRRALLDSSPAVREMAAQAFDELQSNIGVMAVDQILPALLNDLNSNDKSDVALDALKELMAVRSNVVFPVLIPTLLTMPITSFNAKALASLISVSGTALIKRLNLVLPPLIESLGTIRDDVVTNDIKQAIHALIVAIDDDEGVDAVASELLSYITRTGDNGKKLDMDNNMALLVGGCIALTMFATTATADFSAYTPELLKTTLDLFVHEDIIVVQQAWSALDAIVKSIRKDDFDQYVGTTRRQLANMASRKAKDSSIPGFCLPKGIGPILPIFLQGLMYGSTEVKQQAAYAIGDIINTSTADALKPFVTQITGPLIRIISDRISIQLKSAILSTLGALLAKTTVLLKPFLPQLQRTFVKALFEGDTSVRTQAVKALTVLVSLQARLDPLVTELCTGIKSVDQVDIKVSMLTCLCAVLAKEGADITGPSKQLAMGVLKETKGGGQNDATALVEECLILLGRTT